VKLTLAAFLAVLLAIASPVDFGLSGAYAMTGLVGFEAGTVWRKPPTSPYESSFGLAPGSPSPPPPVISKNIADAWVGTWDTVTSDGRVYTLDFYEQGNRLEGFVAHADRRFAARFSGALSPAGNEVTFTLTEPVTGDISRGRLHLTNKETFEGSFSRDRVPNTTFSWHGTRKQ
jgi:hypothetical protein